MNKSGDLTGRVFGELTVLWEANRGNNGGSSWVCKCSCGHIDTFEGNRLLSGHNTHCRYCGFGRFRFFDHYTKVECILPKDKSFIFDYADFSLVSQYKWFICKQGYPKTAVGPRNPNGVCLHQLLMKPPKGLFVDHIDGNPLNNCRENLRICTHAQNQQNTKIPKTNSSGYKGVSFDKCRNKWMAYITAKGKRHHLGRYETPEEAADAYDKAASLYFGEFARTNEMIQNLEKGVCT